MATATRKARRASRLQRLATDVRVPQSMKFLIFEDEGGDYHWTIVAGDGSTLARSGSFASYDAATAAAKQVRDGASSALFERRAAGARPVDLIAPRDAERDATDAERWLDEGGSFSSEAVAKWSAPR